MAWHGFSDAALSSTSVNTSEAERMHPFANCMPVKSKTYPNTLAHKDVTIMPPEE